LEVTVLHSPITAFDTLQRSGEEDDAALVKAAKRDPQAFTALYQRYVNRIYRYIYSRVSSKADVEDLTAQVFLEALEGLRSYREQGTFSAWLFTIAHRRIVDHYRHQRPTFPLNEDLDSLTADFRTETVRFSPSASATPLANVVQEERLQRLACLVQQLDENQQALLSLRFAAGLTYDEMATVLRKTEGAVKMAVHRLLRRLESEWENNNA